MTTLERNTYLQLGNGDPDAFKIVFTLTQFRRRGEVCLHLIRRGIVGQKLVDYFYESKSDPFNMYQRIIKEIDGLMARPINKMDLI